MPDAVADTSVAELVAEVASLREQVAAVHRLAQRAEDRGQVENLFNRYMYLHNAFQDEQIIPLWVEKGTEGIRAPYTNAGQYTTWESVTRYHRGRPSPEGKLILHATTTPVVFMPPADEPVPDTNHPYSPETVQKLEPVPPVTHDRFTDTFA